MSSPASPSIILIGLAAGWPLALLMRSWQLHYSWALLVLALLLAARSGLTGGGWALVAAAASAGVIGGRWQHRDTEAGEDLAALASSRLTPVDPLRGPARAAARALRGDEEADRWFHGGELELGTDERGRVVSVPVGSPGAAGHVLVVGATGSGKTVTETWIAVRAIGRGLGAIVVDPKGDRSLREEVGRCARQARRPFIEWTPRGPTVYNPYARGSETEIADKLLAGERFTEPHYLRQSQRYLGHLLRMLSASGSEVSLQSIVDHLDPARLEQLARRVELSRSEATHCYLDALTARQLSDLSGVRDRLAIVAESDVGRWLDPRTPGARSFDLLEAVQARAVVYFALEADSRPLLSEMLGAALIQDLQTTIAALQGRPTPTLVLIDEYSALAAEHVVRLFGRARSAGFSLLLATQELSDLRPPGRERLLEQISGNLSALVAHRQVVPASAELIAEMSGKMGAWRVSRHGGASRTRTRTRTRVPVLDAEQIMTLERGWAAVIRLDGRRETRIARVHSPGRRS